jgi:GNAT superfamily N-acetyltransferase
MFDMLVRLYDLPDHSAWVGRLRDSGVEIRRALPPETPVIRRFVERNFSSAWASECDRAIQNWPVSCYLALEGESLLGFACYDATCRGFFGPTAVLERARGRGIGKALLWCALRGMAEYGYAYAIIGGVGPDKFYADAVGAVPIAGSDPGIFRGALLRDPEEEAK